MELIRTSLSWLDEAERPGGPDNLEDNLSRLTVDDIKSHYKSELDALNNNFNGISPITF